MRLVFHSLLLLLTACPADDTTPGNESSSSSSGSGATTAGTSATSVGSTSVGPTSVGPTSASSSGSTGSADESSSGDPACPGFEDEASGGPITIEITNTRGEGIWIPLEVDCIESVPHVITGPDGQEVAWRNSGCGTCEDAVQGQCPCPPPFCDEQTGLYIEAGATAEYMWSGLAHVQETIPEACPGIPMCGETCARAVLPAAGDHTFSIQAGRVSGCATEPCTCMPNNGSCTLYDAGMTFAMLTDFSATIDLPGESTVEIVID